MAIKDAIFALLNQDPGVTAIAAGRIYPLITPEAGAATAGILPAVAYFRVSSKRDYTQDAFAPGPRGPQLVTSRYQFDCKANDYDSARGAADAIGRVLNGYKGVAAGVTIQGAFETDDREDYDHVTKVRTVQKDFMISYLE